MNISSDFGFSYSLIMHQNKIEKDMQSEEDIKIQNKLESAGNGLPSIDAIFLKHIGFPILKTFIPWSAGMKFFEYEGRRILNSSSAKR